MADRCSEYARKENKKSTSEYSVFNGITLNISSTYIIVHMVKLGKLVQSWLMIIPETRDEYSRNI